MHRTLILRLAGATLLAGGLAACDPGYQTGLSPDVQRAGAGALVGAGVTKIVDGDVATGALIGAAGGAICDDVGVCQQRTY